MRFNAIGNGRFSALLTRMFWIKSGEAAAPSCADEIAPHLDVNQQDDRMLPFLRGERLAAGFNNVQAIALNFAVVGVVNPFGSNVICDVEQISVRSSVTGNLIMWIYSAYAGTSISSKIATFRDARWLTTAAAPSCGTTGFLTTVDPTFSAVSGQVLEVIRSTLNTDYVRYPKVVLPPGSALYIGHGTIETPNLELGMAQWRERPVAMEELATG